MNKKDIRKVRLLYHYRSLEKLAALCNSPIKDGKKLSLKLLKIEKSFSKVSENYCNGIIQEDIFDNEYNKTEKAIFELLPGIEGFFLNTDPRGYCLKIDLNEISSIGSITLFSNLGLQTDFGGYLLLSPLIE